MWSLPVVAAPLTSNSVVTGIQHQTGDNDRLAIYPTLGNIAASNPNIWCAMLSPDQIERYRRGDKVAQIAADRGVATATFYNAIQRHPEYRVIAARRRRNLQNKRLIKCEWCEGEFEPRSRKVRFCSRLCSNRHNWGQKESSQPAFRAEFLRKVKAGWSQERLEAHYGRSRPTIFRWKRLFPR